MLYSLTYRVTDPMINFLLKYLGVYGLLGVVAVAVITPAYYVFSGYEKNQSEAKIKLEKQGSETTNNESSGSDSGSETTNNESSGSDSGSNTANNESSESKSNSGKGKKTKLLIDIFRVDEFGNILTAGNISEPADIEILSDNQEIIGSSQSEGNGNFVVFGKIQGTGLVQTVKIRGLITKENDQKVVVSENLFFVLPKIERNKIIEKTEKIKVPTIVRDDGKDLKVLKPIYSNPVDSITLDTISYRADSATVLAGRARIKHIVRVYLNNNFISETNVDESGGWLISLTDVDSGLYTLRLDEVNIDGQVQGRLELPFKREKESLVQAIGEGSITVQPGNSLWRIARKYYGQGIQYIDIFDRNSHLIKDPDLIYPGQIFSLPN